MNKMIDARVLSEAAVYAKTHHFRLLVKEDGISVEKKRHAIEYVKVVAWEEIEASVANIFVHTMVGMRAEFE